MSEQPAIGTILFEVALLTIVVILVDEPLIRTALAAVPALLLAQRAIGSASAEEIGEWTPANDRRMNEHVREHVTKLLDHFRDFYTMCHLVGSGRIGSEGALERANELEKDLNALLNQVNAGAREAAGVPLVEAGVHETEPDEKPVAELA